MTEVTKEMILDYLIKKGGVVKNVDLVRHFRKYLQVENSALKGKKNWPRTFDRSWHWFLAPYGRSINH